MIIGSISVSPNRRHAKRALGCDIANYIICNHHVYLVQQWWNPIQVLLCKKQLCSVYQQTGSQKVLRSVLVEKNIENQRSNLIGCINHSQTWLVATLFFGCSQTFVLSGVGMGMRLLLGNVQQKSAQIFPPTPFLSLDPLLLGISFHWLQYRMYILLLCSLSA